MVRKAALALFIVAGGMGLTKVSPGQNFVPVPIPLTIPVPNEMTPPIVYVEPVLTGHGYAGDKPKDAPLEGLVKDLASDDYLKRERASRELFLLGPERLADVRRLLEQSPDPEVAARLQDVAIHLYLKGRTPLKGDTALLGVRSDWLSFEQMRVDPTQDNLQMTIGITQVEPGFPVAQVLFTGDRLVAMDGERFDVDMDFMDFREKLIKHSPGSMVKFTVWRGGKLQEVSVQMASLTQNKTDQSDALAMRNEAVRRFVEKLRDEVGQVTLVVPEPPQYRDVPIQSFLR